MGKLIKAEFYKLEKLPSVRIIFLFACMTAMLRGFSPYPGYQMYTTALVPELFDAVLVSVFTAAFLCAEFSNRTFGNAALSGVSRQNVFFAKLAVYFPGLLVLVLLPLAVSVCSATIRNGFGADWDAVVWDIIEKLLFYILYRFFMAGFAIFAATLIQNSIGMLGTGVAGIYLITLIKKPMEHPVTQITLLFTIIEISIFLSLAAFIFAKREL